MKFVVAFGLVAFMVAPAVIAPAPAFAQPSTAALDQVQQHLRAVRTMTANFAQTDRRGRTLSGHLSIKRPGKMRFQYVGNRMLIVASGGRLNFIDYDARQQQSWPIDQSPLALLVDPDFDLRSIGRIIRNDRNTLMIEVRNPLRPEFGRMTLAFAKIAGAPGGLSLQGWNSIDGQGNLTQLRLSGQRYDVAVPDSRFDYQPLPPRAAER